MYHQVTQVCLFFIQMLKVLASLSQLMDLFGKFMWNDNVLNFSSTMELGTSVSLGTK